MADLYFTTQKLNSEQRRRIEDRMTYFPDIRVRRVDTDRFSLFYSSVDRPDMAEHFRDKKSNSVVVISGRIMLHEREWQKTEKAPELGGLAARYVWSQYQKRGAAGLTDLNGAFLAVVFDSAEGRVRFVTDRTGMHPAFIYASGKDVTICSHPDIIAATIPGIKYDMVSLAQFLSLGKLTPPYTYYEGINFLRNASIHNLELDSCKVSSTCYFNNRFDLSWKMSDREIAQELATAFQASVEKRINPRFGKAWISLSGGLDSRAILSAAEDRQNVVTFCFFDNKNLEYRLAEEIARAAQVPFIPLQRSPEHYGINAAKGTAISAGMGDFGSNHYLGFRETLKEHRADNLITGFYCDYLFKGLELDRRQNRLSGHEILGEFKYSNYMPIYKLPSKLSAEVMTRLDKYFSLDDDSCSQLNMLEFEKRRIMPLCYEPDNQETLVPLRTLGGALPAIDNDVLDVYLKIPPAMKINNRFYPLMVSLLGGPEMTRILNINTRCRVDASRSKILRARYIRFLNQKFFQNRRSIATEESWPNWIYYIRTSKVLGSIWEQKNNGAGSILQSLVGDALFNRDQITYSNRDSKLFLRMITLLLWLNRETAYK